MLTHFLYLSSLVAEMIFSADPSAVWEEIFQSFGFAMLVPWWRRLGWGEFSSRLATKLTLHVLGAAFLSRFCLRCAWALRGFRFKSASVPSLCSLLLLLRGWSQLSWGFLDGSWVLLLHWRLTAIYVLHGSFLVPMPLLLPYLSGSDSLLRSLSACALRSDFCGHDQLTCLCLNLRHRVSGLLVLSRLRCALRSLDQLTALS